MKINLSLSIEDAQRLLRILHDTRHAMSVNASSMSWMFRGASSVSFSIEDVVFIEDLQSELLEKLDEDNQSSRFAGCLQVF